MPGAAVCAMPHVSPISYSDSRVISYRITDTEYFRRDNKPERNQERTMHRQSLIAAAFVLAAVTLWAIPASAAPASTHHRTVVHHVYMYEPAPSPYYGPYYGPSYPPTYAPLAPVISLPGAAVCLAFSLIGGC